MKERTVSESLTLLADAYRAVEDDYPALAQACLNLVEAMVRNHNPPNCECIPCQRVNRQ